MTNWTADDWRRNRRTHRWVTLDGENYSCSYCDTKTGTEVCPEWVSVVPTPEELDVATKTERETPSLGLICVDYYEDRGPEEAS